MPRTQIEKVWLAAGGLVALVLILIGYAFFIGPQRSHTSSVNSKVAAARLENASLRAKISSLQAQSKNLSKYQADLAQARLALPSTSGLPDFLRTLQSIGNATLANVTSLSVLAPADVTAIAVPVRPVAVATNSSGDTTRGVPGTVTATVNGARVYALPITAEVTGSQAQLAAFLTQLQQVQPRAVLISAIDLKAGTSASAAGGHANPNSSTLDLTMQAFVAPSSAAENALLSAAAHK